MNKNFAENAFLGNFLIAKTNCEKKILFNFKSHLIYVLKLPKGI